MANAYDNRSAADIERAIEEDRRRIDAQISEIQERLSPNHMMDEMLAYARSSGGRQYVSNLGESMKNNPLPVALMGLGIAWLMAMPRTGPRPKSQSDRGSYRNSGREFHDMNDDYPLASIQGEIRRTGPAYEEEGHWYSKFTDAAGNSYKAISDKTGRRAGHFMDENGRTFRGFVDASGRRIETIKDEAGNLLDEASGWASKTWRHAKDAVGNIGSRVSQTSSSVGSTSASAMRSLQEQSSTLNRMILTLFRDQPLVGGAIAFAVGAAIGATLPRTETEDDIMGESADAVRDQVSSQTFDLLQRGKEVASDVASDVYEKAAGAASEVRDVVKERLGQESQHFQSGTQHFEGVEPSPRPMPSSGTRPGGQL